MSGTSITEGIYGPIPPNEELPAPPLHCQKCGRALIYREDPDGFRLDGTPLYCRTWRCPKTVGWWNRSLTFMHDEYEPDKFHDWYWRRREYG